METIAASAALVIVIGFVGFLLLGYALSRKAFKLADHFELELRGRPPVLRFQTKLRSTDDSPDSDSQRPDGATDTSKGVQ